MYPINREKLLYLNKRRRLYWLNFYAKFDELEERLPRIDGDSS